jgi:putative transposase
MPAAADLPGACPPLRREAQGLHRKQYAQLLDAAHQQLTGPVVLVWDNLNTHVSRAMSDLVAARDWLTVFRLPPDAPEFNPVESLWSVLKDPWPASSNTTSAS